MLLNRAIGWVCYSFLTLTPTLAIGGVVVIDLNDSDRNGSKEIRNVGASSVTEMTRNRESDIQYKCIKIPKLIHEVGDIKVEYSTNLIRCELLTGFYQLAE